MTNTTLLQDVRNAIKMQVRILAFQKLLSAPQINKILAKTERGHYTTLKRLFDTLKQITTKTTLKNIFSGSVEAKKEYNVSDAVKYRNNKKLFGKSEHRNMSVSGGIIRRVIKSQNFELKSETIDRISRFIPITVTPVIQKQLQTYDELVNIDMNKANKLLYKNVNTLSARVQPLVAYVTRSADNIDRNEQIVAVAFIKNPFEFFKDTIKTTDDIKNMKSKIESFGSNVRHYIIGYNIIYRNYDETPVESIQQTLNNFLAFKPSNDADFHKLTYKATNKNKKLCIYESFEDVNKFNTQSNYFKNYKLEQRLSREGAEIESNVIEGKLFKSLQLLNIKYKKEAYVVFYGDYSVIHIDANGVITMNIQPTKPDQLVYLYDKEHMHVASALYNKLPKPENIVKEIKTKDYTMYPIKQNKKPVDIEKKKNNCIGFDFETVLNKECDAIPIACNVHGKLLSQNIKKSFYGLDCATQFIDWLLQYKTLLHHNKHNESESINYIRVYGFNSSNFDNKFIYTLLHERDNNAEMVMNNGSIKRMIYNNISFYDLNLLYASGSLNTVCESLGLGQKIDFDITTVTMENYNDINIKNDVIKYCSIDAELTYKLALDYIENSVGKINGINYDVSDCITAGSVAKKIFQQVFQKDILVASPSDVLVAEKQAFFGGRNSIFKREFKSTNPQAVMYDIDLNSSYGKAMTLNQPYKFLRNVEQHQIFNITNSREIINTRLYYISSYKYLGTDSNIINNIVERNDKGEMVTYKKYDVPSVHWGIELKECALNNFEIITYKYSEYIEKPIFKEFSEYFYNERLTHKDAGNISKAKFYKNISTNFFGKFSQKTYAISKIVNSFDDIFKYIDDDMSLLVNYTNMNKGLGLLEYKSPQHDDINGLIRFSSYIAAVGRVQLSRCMRNIGFDHIYYCATDSIFTDKMPDAEFLSERELGKFKVENVIKQASFISAGVYTVKTFDNDVIKKSKAIKADLLSEEDFVNLSEGKSINKTHTKFIKNVNGCKIVNMSHTLKPTFRQII
jgi:hypothetical protein